MASPSLPPAPPARAPRRIGVAAGAALFTAAQVVLWAGAALLLLYLVGMNLFLGTRWFRDAIAFCPEEFAIEYTRAYSIVPGRIHVENLRIRGSDSAVQWILRLDACDFRVRFADLARRSFHAEHVRGNGLSMRIRMRLDEGEDTKETVEALPPVPGFADPPYRLIGPPKAPLTDEDYNLWSIQLDDVVAEHVHEIWVHTARFSGDARVTGRWLFRPVRWLEVGPARIDASELDVSYGRSPPLFARVHGAIDATVHPFDVRVPEGLDVLRDVSVVTSLSGDAATGRIVETLDRRADVTVQPDRSPFVARLSVDHGSLRAGSYLAVAAASAEASTGGTSFRGAFAAELRVDDDPDRPVARLGARVADLEIRDRRGGLGRVASGAARVASLDVDLTHPSLDSATYSVEAHGAQAPGLAALEPLLPRGVAARSGAVTADGHLEGRVREASASGAFAVSIRRLTVSRGEDRVDADVQAAVSVPDASWSRGSLNLAGSRLVLDGIEGFVAGIHARARTLRIAARAARLARGSEPDVVLDFDLPAAELPDLRDLNPVLPTDVHVRSGAVRVGGAASLRLRARELRGSDLVVRTLGLDVDLGRESLVGEAEAHVESAAARWGRSGRVELGGVEATVRDGLLKSRDGERVALVPRASVGSRRLVFDADGSRGVVSLELPRIEVPDLPALARSFAPAGAVRVTRGAAIGALQGDLDLAALSASGEAELLVPELGVEVGADDYEGELTAHVVARAAGRDPEATLLSGTRLAFTSSSRTSEPWWARAWLSDAEVKLAGGASFRADAHIAAQNAAPVQALLARVTPVPRWVLDAFPTDHLRADGEVRGTRTSLEARRWVMRSEGTEVRLEYAKQASFKQAMALVRSGNLRLGFTLAGAGEKFMLFGAEGWFDRRVRALRARTNAWSLPTELE